MSTKTNRKVVQSYTVEAKIDSMPKSRLPELIEKARNTGLSFRDIQRRAGGSDRISLSTINAAHKGSAAADNLSLNKILALAKGLGESPTVVFEAAIGKTSTGIRDESMRQLLEDFGRLPNRDKDELKPILEMFRAEVQKRLDRNL